MILQALAGYYRRISEDDDSGAAPEGFQKKEISFIIMLDKEGHFKGLIDTREGDGKKKRASTRIVPHEVKRSGSKAYESANLLWDNEGYVFGFSSKDAEKAEKQHKSFKECILRSFPDPSVDEGINAVMKFLQSGDFKDIRSHPLWPEIEKKGGNITFKLEGDDYLVCQRKAVKDAIKNYAIKNYGKAGADPQVCLITGEADTPARLHTAIKGVWGAQSSGANIVSFNLDAFNSYGKTQGFNAPVCTKAEHAYTTALNSMLSKDSRQRIQVGDASIVFWADKPNKMEESFADFFGKPSKETSIQDTETIHALYSLPHTGAPPPLLDEDAKFYVLGLSPNASRIAIRFWYQGTVGEVAQNIRTHFDDCRIVHAPKEPEDLSIFRLLVSTAVQGKADNIQPNLSGEVMKSILTGTPYPQTLLSSAIRRVMAERKVAYPRASLIKAVLARASRYYKKTEKEVDMLLDTDNMNIGYRLGRLFSVLEKIQEEASPGIKATIREKIQEEASPGIKATIRDRFYGSASSTPVTAFPHLMKLKNHHLAKLENRGRAVYFERLVGEIIDGVMDFPSHLSLNDQGRFAVGYYHQRREFFTKKQTKEEE